MAIFSLFRSVKNVLIATGVALITFDLSYFMMSKLIGVRDLMCVPGGGLTMMNIFFSLFLSLSMGIIVTGVIEMMRRRSRKSVAVSASGVGMFFGMMTIFCPICTLPVITLFGASISISFFSTYEVLFKVLSLILMIASICLVNSQLKDECTICKY